ncbi:MAG: hypothetical protein AAF709_10585 [Pseudomonadota bacterium]
MAELNRYIIGNDPRPRSERPLEPTLIEQIEDLLDAKLDTKLDERFAEIDRRMDERFAESERRTAKVIEELLHMQKAEIVSELKE